MGPSDSIADPWYNSPLRRRQSLCWCPEVNPDTAAVMDPSSRLDRMIMRLTAQRNCLLHGLALVADLPGPIIEFGLGKGRTYDFLRNHANGRRVIAFDREIHCPPDCVPAPEDLVLGDFYDTVAGSRDRIGDMAALVHFDVGSEDLAADAILVAWLSIAVDPLVTAGAVVIADRVMSNPRWRPLAEPPGGSGNSHFMYRVSD